MQAAYFRGNKVIELVDVPRPAPGPGEVLIRVAANAVCGSDKKIYTGGFERIPGHEAAGTVVEVGAGVHMPVGSRVAAYIPLFCGECRFCRQGAGNICAHRTGLLGWSTDGGYAEYMLLPERNALPLADETSFEEGVLLLDTLGTSGHALRVARYAEAESVLVIGAGPIGIGAVALLQAWGMPRVYVSEFSAYRRQRATEMGAVCIDPASQSVEEFMRAAEPDGVDIVFLAVGSVPAIWQSLDLVRPGGTVSIVGEYSGKLELEQCKSSWMLNDLHIIRTFYFTIPEFAENQRLLRQGRISADALVTHRFALSDISAAYSTFFGGETLKVMVAP